MAAGASQPEADEQQWTFDDALEDKHVKFQSCDVQ